MLVTAESIDCMPDAQLRITVQPGTFSPQPMRSDDAPDVHLVRGRRSAPQDHFVQLGRREGLAQQQRAAGVGREIRRRKRSRADCAP